MKSGGGWWWYYFYWEIIVNMKYIMVTRSHENELFTAVVEGYWIVFAIDLECIVGIWGDEHVIIMWVADTVY